MPSRKKSWNERMVGGRPPEVKRLDVGFAGLRPGTTMLVSSPGEIAAYLRMIPAGQTRSVADMRADLAQTHGADATCPASTPIFLRVVAEAAWEELEAGSSPSLVAPFWRVIEPESRLAQKLTCGAGFVAAMREREQAPGVGAAPPDAALERR